MKDRRTTNLAELVNRIPRFRSTELSRNLVSWLQFSAPQCHMSQIGFLFHVRTICNIPISFLGLLECLFSLFNYLFYPFKSFSH